MWVWFFFIFYYLFSLLQPFLWWCVLKFWFFWYVLYMSAESSLQMCNPRRNYHLLGIIIWSRFWFNFIYGFFVALKEVVMFFSFGCLIFTEITLEMRRSLCCRLYQRRRTLLITSFVDSLSYAQNSRRKKTLQLLLNFIHISQILWIWF